MESAFLTFQIIFLIAVNDLLPVEAPIVPIVSPNFTENRAKLHQLLNLHRDKFQPYNVEHDKNYPVSSNNNADTKGEQLIDHQTETLVYTSGADLSSKETVSQNQDGRKPSSRQQPNDNQGKQNDDNTAKLTEELFVRILGDNLLETVSSMLNQMSPGKEQTTESDLLTLGASMAKDENFNKELDKFRPFIDETVIDQFISTLLPNTDAPALRQQLVSISVDKPVGSTDDISGNYDASASSTQSHGEDFEIKLPLEITAILTNTGSDEFYDVQEDCDMSSEEEEEEEEEEDGQEDESAEEIESKTEQTEIDANKQYEINFNGNARITSTVYNIDYKPHTEIYITTDEKVATNKNDHRT